MKYTKFPGRVMFSALNVMSDFLCSSIECEAKNFLLALAPSATTHITCANIRRCQCVIYSTYKPQYYTHLTLLVKVILLLSI